MQTNYFFRISELNHHFSQDFYGFKITLDMEMMPEESLQNIQDFKPLLLGDPDLMFIARSN